MKYFYIRDFDDDTLVSFLNFANDYWEYKWRIILDSDGGANNVCEQICNILNLRKDDVEIDVTKAISNGFRLLLNFKGKVNILFGAIGMIHLSRVSITYLMNKKLSDNHSSNCEEFRNEDFKTIYDKQILELSKILSVSEMKNFKEGRDVYITYKKMVSIFKNKK